MESFGKSQSVTRIEDLRFLTGHGEYVDDIAPENALVAYFLRAPVAHAVLNGIDVSAALDCPGVAMVVTQRDLEEAGLDAQLSYTCAPQRDGSKGAAPRRPVMALDRLRFVGEAVAMVVAETLDQAKDAAELIELDYEDLPVKLDFAAGGETIHAEAPDNRGYDYGMGDEAATEAAFAKAARVVKLEVGDNRIIVNSMEPRGAFAEWEGDRMHLAFGGQGVWGMKAELARCYGVEADMVRCTNPDVGGGFGMKGQSYPEYFALPFAARKAGRPVHWMSDRTEAMLSDNAGRDLTTTAELAFDADHRILAYRSHTRSNLGAYNSQFGQMIQSFLFSRVLTGCYDIQTVWQRSEGFYTNTTQVDAYRGAGRPEAIYVLERVMDRAARELGVDPMELRRINFIKPEQFPYTTVAKETFDVGEFARVMGKAAGFADMDGFAARRAASEVQGKLRGLGICYYIESILGQPHEDVKVEFLEDGALIYVGTQSNGQGHETVFRQFLSDQTGIPAEKIRVIQGDSDLIPSGGGTGGSRSVTVQANVTLAAVAEIKAGFTDFLADEMGVEAAAISFDDERFRAEGSNVSPTLLEAAQMAREAGRQDLLVWQTRAKLPGRSFPNGCHIAEVEVDTETGQVTCDRYNVVDDFGNLINPMLAEGQVHGGVVQGLGQALCEHVGYDETGQLLTASFMDYAMPRAGDVPWIGFDTDPVPSTANPMGMKGCGEAGTVGALAAVSNAVQDALWDRGIRQADMPFTPSRVWTMLNDGAVAAE